MPRTTLGAENTIRSKAKSCPPRVYSLLKGRKALSSGGIKQDIESTGSTRMMTKSKCGQGPSWVFHVREILRTEKDTGKKCQ